MAKNGDLPLESSSTALTVVDAHSTSSSSYLFGRRIGHIYDRLSQSRQIFCLFCIFDFLFTFLLWIIYAQGVSVSGLDDSLSAEIGHYGISSSLFDILILSFLRVSLLLVVYGYYIFKKAYPIAITTFVSTAYLIIKAFLFEFDESEGSGGRPIDYFLHIGSFVICWAEAWYLQVKVLPREKRAALQEHATPVRNYGTIRQPSEYSFPSFHTPMDQDSGDEEQHVKEDLHYIEKARRTTSKALNFLYAEKQWNIEKRKDDILIESTTDENLGKVLKVRTYINASLQSVYPFIFGDIENNLVWNQAIKQIEVVYKVNSTTDIVYSTVDQAAGGLISARDFVTLRHYQRIGSMFLSTSTGISTDLKPPVDGFVRGETPLNCYALSPTEDDPSKCEFAWITTTTMKPSSIPQPMFDFAMPGFLIDCVVNLRKACEAMSDNGNNEAATT